MRKKIVFFTGAGISIESNIFGFRTKGGLWLNHKIEDVCTPLGWQKNKKLVLDFYNTLRKELLTKSPNDAHLLVAELEKYYDVSVVTQNVDNLHEKAGSTNVIHLHGELFKSRSTLDPTLTYHTTEDINIGDKCEKGSQLRPHVVFFSEQIFNFDKAYTTITSADIFIIIGTSLNVAPASDMIHWTSAKDIYCIDPSDMNTLPRRITHIKEKATVGMKILMDELVKNK